MQALRLLSPCEHRSALEHGRVNFVACARHIEFTADGMTWNIPAELIKTKRNRTIYCTCPDLIAYCKSRMNCGTFVFVNKHGRGWTPNALKCCWRLLRRKLESLNYVFEKEDCFYTTRHTFAKEVLDGKYLGRPTTVHALATLMDNSVRICEKYYLKWSVAHKSRLFELV